MNNDQEQLETTIRTVETELSTAAEETGSEKQLPGLAPQLKTSALPALKTKKATASGFIRSESYPGNKFAGSSWQKIINQFKPHDVFWSGFLGKCAVLAHKKPAKSNVGIEIKLEKVQAFWDTLQRKDIKLIRQDFFEFIKQFTFSKLSNQRHLIYLDPPYLLDSRRSGREYYEDELTEEQHAALIAWAMHTTETSDVMLAISHYPHEMYDRLLEHGWRKITWQVQTHRGTATEALYMNYAEPEALHEYTYLGKDKTDRQRIKRLIDREIKALMRRPLLERNAIMQAVTNLSTPR